MISSKASGRNITVILGGLAGSGKSTVGEMVARRLRLHRASAGDCYRAMARVRGMDVIAFGRFCDSHPAIDRALDRRLLRRAEKGNVVIDGRAVAWFAKRRKLPSLKVMLTVSPETGARRVAGREGISIRRARAQNDRREAANSRRLKRLYGLDTKDTSYYDAVIQTDGYTAKEVVEIICLLAKYGRH